MSATSQNRNPLVVVVPLLSLAADKTVPAGVLPRHCVLLAAYIQNGAAIAASNSDYVVAQLKVGSTVKASLDSRAAGQGALVQNVGKAMAISDSDLPAGSSLTLAYDETDTGSNVALTDALLVMHLEQKGSA